MKLIYYSTAYFASHGGSTHSRHFFEQAGKHRLIEKALLFPGQGARSVSKDPLRGSFRKWLRTNGLAQLFFFIRRNRFHYKALKNLIDTEKPDAIIIRLDSNFLQVDRLRRQFPRLTVATEINASPFDESFGNILFKSLFRQLERRILKHSLNFFVSDYLRRSIMGGDFDENTDVVVHNGVDPLKFFPSSNMRDEGIRLQKEHGDFVIGYIGTLDAHKRVDVLLRAFAMVCAEVSQVRLVVVGDGPERTVLEQQVLSLGLTERVTFTGWVEHARIPDYIRALSLAVHHHAEKYMSPLKLFEYMACGIGVIGPDTPAVTEVFTNGKELLLTDGTEKDLNLKIRLLINDSEKLSQLARQGRLLVENSFTWERNADIIIRKIHNRVRGGSSMNG